MFLICVLNNGGTPVTGFRPSCSCNRLKKCPNGSSWFGNIPWSAGAEADAEAEAEAEASADPCCCSALRITINNSYKM